MYAINFKEHILNTNTQSTLRFKMHLSDIIHLLPNKTKSYRVIHKIIDEHYKVDQKDFQFTSKEKILKETWLEYYKTILQRNF
jgi:hypothetical protein